MPVSLSHRKRVLAHLEKQERELLMIRRRLSTKQREALYDEEAAKAAASARGPFPICRLCDLPIFPGQRWHENHDRYLPHAIGGKRDGISHERCNLEHGHKVATPQVAKVKRIRQKHIGAWHTTRPLPGGRDDDLMRKMNGKTVLRSTGQKP